MYFLIYLRIILQKIEWIKTKRQNKMLNLNFKMQKKPTNKINKNKIIKKKILQNCPQERKEIVKRNKKKVLQQQNYINTYKDIHLTTMKI